MLFRLKDNNHSVGIVQSCFAIEPTEIKYLIRAGWYRLEDGKSAYISKGMIAKLHGVPLDECIAVYPSRNRKLPDSYKLLKELKWDKGVHR